jgi:hypothetical protein
MNSTDSRAHRRSIYAADIGSTRAPNSQHAKSSFGWARLLDAGQVEGGMSISDRAMLIAADLQESRSVALGLEAPLAIPVPIDAKQLSRGREGEGSRSFAAPPGLAVTTLGLHQAAWLLSHVRQLLGDAATRVRFTQEADAWPSTELTFFCWEAFVSQDAHSQDHVRDAATAAVAFVDVESHLTTNLLARAERPLSVVAAAALWSGWLTDPRSLHVQPPVIRPIVKYEGPITLFASEQVRTQ